MLPANQRIPYGSSSRSSNVQQGVGAPAIRAGLSVQELKAMTAMRMATTDESSSRPFVPQRSQAANIASSYQTATPQQLQAAGILPVVINDRNNRNSRNLRAVVNTGVISQPNYSQSNYLSNSVTEQSRSIPFRRNPPLGPVQQSNFPLGELGFSEFQWPDASRPASLTPLTESGKSMPPAYNNHMSSSQEGLVGGVRSPPPRVLPPQSMYADSHNNGMQRLDRGAASQFSQIGSRGINRNPVNLSLAHPGLEGTHGERGPEVRSPPFASQFLSPDEQSEFYGTDMIYSQQQQSQNGNADLLRDSFSLLSLSAQDNAFLKTRSLESDMPRQGAKPFHRARSQSSLDAFSFGQDEYLKQHSLPQIHHPFSPQVETVRENEEVCLDKLLGDRMQFLKNGNMSPDSNSFPLMKSKTVPKLGGHHDMGMSPLGSPVVKMIPRKLPRCNSKDAVEFLFDEVAESVLHTPPTMSPTHIRKLKKTPGFDALSSAGNMGSTVKSLPPDTFFPSMDSVDDRFTWDAGFEDEDAVTDAAIDAHCETCDLYDAKSVHYDNNATGSDQGIYLRPSNQLSSRPSTRAEHSSLDSVSGVPNE
eukprot:gene3495-3827_t